MVHPLIGKKAPSLTLQSATADSYELSPGSSGKPMAIFFYPAAGTYGCTREACAFRDSVKENEVFRRTECEIVGISGDNQAKQRAFVDEHGLPYPVLCDTEGKAREAYQVGRGMLNLAEGRATFLIDKDGTVVDVFESVIQYYKHKDFVEKWLANLPASESS